MTLANPSQQKSDNAGAGDSSESSATGLDAFDSAYSLMSNPPRD